MTHPHQTAGMAIARPRPPKALISLVPMIDVMLILLVFFMVTSTYLNLDMIPAIAPSDGAAAPAGDAPQVPLLIRIGADGAPGVQGRVLALDDLASLLRARLAETPLMPVVILPSGGADMQALISVMDTAAAAGAVQLRVIRLEARP